MVSASECRPPDLERLLPEWGDHVSAVVPWLVRSHDSGRVSR